MDENTAKCCSLPQAQRAILTGVMRLADEIVDLDGAYRRIAARDIFAALPQPTFDEATRDGFVLSSVVGSDENQAHHRYRIIGEIPAGKPHLKTLAPGTACRIMTGGCIPEGGMRVVPYECCAEQNGEAIIPDHLLRSPETYLRKAGSEIVPGDLLVTAGVPIQAGHIALLASCGKHSVAVSARPAVGHVCTGSELVAPSEPLDVGWKVSSNAFLVKGMLALVGGHSIDMGIVNDSAQELRDLFAKVKRAAPEAMISTGGMGPGKYDLVEKAFVDAGGQVIFNAISMRPGKSVLFGIMGRTLFFGLPGPPTAVRILLNELVGPALLSMQGAKGSWPRKTQAHLQHRIEINRNDVLRLKDGMLATKDGRYSVRFARRLEIPNCFILLPPGQLHYNEDTLMEVHPALELCAGLPSE